MEEADREIRSSGMEWRQIKLLYTNLVRLRLKRLHLLPHAQCATRHWINSNCNTSFAECKYQTGEEYSRMGLTIAL